MEEWNNKIRNVFYDLPTKLRGHRPRVVFQSMALDDVLARDMVQHQELAMNVGKSINHLHNEPTRDNLRCLYNNLDAYYLARRDVGEFERRRLERYKDKPLFPIFVLSYGRPERNSTLDCLEKWDDDEVYANTLVFTDQDQVESYQRNHPRWNYYAKDCKNVGERFDAVMQYCRDNNIRYFVVLEDDIDRFCYVKKGGIDFNSKCNKVDEEYDAVYLKYWMHKGKEIFERNPSTALIGMRNRACCHVELTTIIGYQFAMRGGCPNLAFLIDRERFEPVWQDVSPEHYSPQYDWAIQCSLVKNNMHWNLITAITKHENTDSHSVIGYQGDRIKLAEEYLRYYGVEDQFKISVVKSKKQSIKLTYAGELYDEEWL